MTAATPYFYPPHYRSIDPRIRRELLAPHALDGHPLSAQLYLPPLPAGQVEGSAAPRDPDTVLLLMHPRGDFQRHYAAPHLALGGYAVCGATTRNLHNDADALHERLLLDVGGVIQALRERFARVVLLGNSGGGSLFAFYLQQQGKAPAERLTHAPSGDRVPLADFELPPADGLVLIAAHQGEGRFMLERLDPSVVDEHDPVLVNPRLDMYDPRNGYRPMREGPSRYSAEFLAEFRRAQHERCERLDARCLAWCEEARLARLRAKAEGLPPDIRRDAARRGITRRYMLIYRTLADPRYLDPTLDPNRRPIGSLFAIGGRDPITGNYGEGLGRVMSARGWLSTWSGLRSQAALEKTLPDVHVPLLVVYADADTEIYEHECRAQLAWAASRDKTFTQVDYVDHYFHSVGPEGDALGEGRARLCNAHLLPWLRERYQA
ncbi:MAG: hypothetical protein R3B40_19955 [Polyangiales bacterium]|nr:hypothetical protein [Myxococcales bacterium]MCB9659389.1 hypothetical protein [Sandaracinaceae bacterium]